MSAGEPVPWGHAETQLLVSSACSSLGQGTLKHFAIQQVSLSPEKKKKNSVIEHKSYIYGLLTFLCAFSLRCASGDRGFRGGGGGVGDSEGQQSRKSNNCKLHGG